MAASSFTIACPSGLPMSSVTDFLLRFTDGVVRGLGRVVARRVLDVGRAPAARVVAGAGALDLDDFGAEVGKVLRRPGAGQHAGKVEDADM